MEKHPVQKQNFRAKEAAEYLGIALSTVWLYAKQGRLNPVKLSPRITVFKKTDLDNLIENGMGAA
ncbi:MAG: helix-turn-helix domain-containing protein [Sulfurovum sp.]|nr:helix-turn-helix domain-containing protein [Sulfurovum sp.]